MSHVDKPKRLLCLNCASLVDPAQIQDGRCPVCGELIDVDELVQLYEYAAETYYYGHQYRVIYEEQFKQTDKGPRYSLQFAGEAFAWIMLAVLSGVVGNAAYDLLKVVVLKIRADVEAGKLSDRDYTALLTLSDEELGNILYSAKQYITGMDGLTREVREAIAEEIAADAVSHEPKIAEEMLKLMSKKSIKPKDRQRFAQLLRQAIVRQQKRTKPSLHKLQKTWGGVRDEG